MRKLRHGERPRDLTQPSLARPTDSSHTARSHFGCIRLLPTVGRSPRTLRGLTRLRGAPQVSWGSVHLALPTWLGPASCPVQGGTHPTGMTGPLPSAPLSWALPPQLWEQQLPGDTCCGAWRRAPFPKAGPLPTASYTRGVSSSSPAVPAPTPPLPAYSHPPSLYPGAPVGILGGASLLCIYPHSWEIYPVSALNTNNTLAPQTCPARSTLQAPDPAPNSLLHVSARMAGRCLTGKHPPQLLTSPPPDLPPPAFHTQEMTTPSF